MFGPILQSKNVFVIHKNAMESGNLRGASRSKQGKQGMMAGTGPATVSGAASALLQSSLENSCELYMSVTCM